jgi:hypothetical protein
LVQSRRTAACDLFCLQIEQLLGSINEQQQQQQQLQQELWVLVDDEVKPPAAAATAAAADARGTADPGRQQQQATEQQQQERAWWVLLCQELADAQGMTIRFIKQQQQQLAADLSVSAVEPVVLPSSGLRSSVLVGLGQAGRLAAGAASVAAAAVLDAVENIAAAMTTAQQEGVNLAVDVPDFSLRPR